jgi:insertion element IS1 protein InsB
MNKRGVQCSPSSFTVPTVEARRGERDGPAPNGKQKYRCHACGRRSRENPTPNAYLEVRRQELLHASQERSSLRSLPRTDRGSLAPPCPVGSKNRSSASSLLPHLARPRARRCHFHDAGTGRRDGSCVLNQANDSGIWIALGRQTRQVVAYAVGDRSKKTCQRLWEAIPSTSRTGQCFTDFWAPPLR